MKKLILPIIFTLLFLVACAKSPAPNKDNIPNKDTAPVVEPKVADYFPIKKDIHLVYKGTGNEFAEYETYVDYIKENVIQVRTINPGTSMVNVYDIKDGMLKKVYSRGEVYYRYNYTSSRSEEEILIKEPIKIGTTWTLKDGTVRTITAVNKNISTPAGSYSALEITSKGPQSTITDYYVKDIGHVKKVFKVSDSTTEVISELEKREENVPLKQKVRFYFPDFVGNKIVYQDRDIEILTNEDMKYKFQKELKTIPENSQLTKVLTTNTQVSSPVLDVNKNTLTVDFSAHLISEMNSGSSLESMLLKCITNTFGNYYQVNKVIITIEGKPYQSGHIAMKPGEAFTVDLKEGTEFKR